jgi:LysR family glycine cleavage system transcriptional activator
LQTLRAFEAAARHLNFRRAADELHVTPSAVSHQIAALEATLGRPLFARRGRTMVLDAAGQALAAALRGAFGAMADALALASVRREPPGLTVSTIPSFAACWLLPRLPRYTAQRPDMPFNLQTTVALADFTTDGVMIAIRYGKGQWPGLVAERLLEERLMPVCAPHFNRGRLPTSPRELATLPVLCDGFHPWEWWLDGVGAGDLALESVSSFSDSALMLEAASQGLGVALGREVLAGDRLASGALVRPFATSVRSNHDYYVVYPERLARDARVRTFRDWLFEEAAATGTPRAGVSAGAAHPARPARRAPRRHRA